MAKYIIYRYEFFVSLVSLALSVLIYSGVYGLAKTNFELLGSAAIPKVVAASLFFLSLVKLAQTIKAANANVGVKSREEYSGNNYKSFFLFLLVSGFVFCVLYLNIKFWIASFFFVFISTVFLKKPDDVLGVIKIIFFALLFSLGVSYLFTKIFYFGL
ncbi:hypothetical protein ACBP93_06970 [Paenalcaligenes hominis]|uniref:Tripartite tricarboxylate transporter TctB family protein n=1 Tax=Paenalcaligenes hominis TaxID=643674 RepID=A0ABX0WTA4_9BURK|nr:hypothetical protein [Paenalcaligenes hominis]NJB66010.1 hypothetical protein [Paenalcaligenes hominis]GGE71393.1 hypothetical protein GCM10007278_19460 [Paenalcaligenes hominis]